MARPQVVDIDALLDHARALWVSDGEAAVTIRALSASSGVSNGAIYHHFNSRTHLLAQVWAREAAALQACQNERIDEVRQDGSAEDAVVAAALATGDCAVAERGSFRILSGVEPDSLTAEAVPDEVADQVRGHQADAEGLIAELAEDAWGRKDDATCRLMRTCVIEIPAGIFAAAADPNDELARHAVEHAVRGIVRAGPPE